MAAARYPLFYSFPMRGRRRSTKGEVQRANELVDIAAWTQAELRTEGARGGSWFIAPGESEYDFLEPNHAYFLKPSIEWAPWQYWNELIAYRLGACIGISVPPTHAAYNTLTRETGALSESFLSVTGREQFLPGSTLLGLPPGATDRRRDRLHNFQAISDWIAFLERNRLTSVDWREHWAKAFLLDTLLGNTDRHADNWGAILTWGGSKESLRPAPFYDNGTSMGYEWPAARLTALANSKWLAKYVYRGRHHMFWRETDAGRLSHPAFLRKFFDEFPAQRPGIISRLKVSDKTIERVVDEITRFRGPRPLSRERASFMVKLIKFRRDHLKDLLHLRLH